MITPADSVPKFYGLSTDDKPENAPNASKFYEMDTGKFYMYDEESQTWLEQ